MPRPGSLVALCALLLLTMGVVMVHSAGMAVTPVSADAPTADGAVSFETIVLSRATAYAAGAMLLLLIAWRLPVRWACERFARVPEPRMPVAARREFALLIFATLALAGVLLLVYLPGLGREFNGASRWIGFPLRPIGSPKNSTAGVTLQPSEIAKWGAVILLAWWCGRRLDRMDRFWTGLLPPLMAVGALAAIITLEDLGTAVLICAACAFVLLASGVRLWHTALFAPPALAAFAAACWFSPYRMERLITFLNPYADPQESGYHIIQSLTAIAGAGPFGRGLGHGLQKFGYLPEDTTDFLFAIVCEEMGLAGAAAVCAAYAVLVCILLAIARREAEPALRLLVVGVTATIGLQALINLLVVTGLAPTKGIALPLMSAGGTGWLLTAGALGLVAAVDRTQPHIHQHDERSAQDGNPLPTPA